MTPVCFTISKQHAASNNVYDWLARPSHNYRWLCPINGKSQ